MQKLRALLPGGGNHQQNANSAATNGEAAQRHTIALEPEVGFQITIESSQQPVPQTVAQQQSPNATTLDAMCQQQKISIPELNVHLLAARHLPNLFGFKVVQGYQVKVKLFPGSKRLDSSIQTNSWPKFNENFRFPLLPDIKPSLKHSTGRGGSKTAVSELFTPEELFAGQFVVFTVYALLELPPASFNRFNKTYRSLRDKSSNLVQKVVESSTGKTNKDEKENEEITTESVGVENRKSKRKAKEQAARESMPILTISESRRNLGSVTCYLEPKLFKRNSRNGFFATEELWLPIKDITTTAKRTKNNDLSNAPKGVVEIILEVRDAGKAHKADDDLVEQQQQQQTNNQQQNNGNPFDRIKTALTPPTTPTPTVNLTAPPIYLMNRQNSSNSNNKNNNNNNKNNTVGNNNSLVTRSQQWANDVRQKIASSTNSSSNSNSNTNATSTSNTNINNSKTPQWQRMTAEVKRKMGMSNISKTALHHHNGHILRITTARMRCTQKVKDELECTAGSVYVKTAVFEHGIFVNSWKSATFYPSLSTKWNVNYDIATLCIPLQSLQSLQHIVIRTTLATKTKLGKKLVLGTVLIGANVRFESGALHLQQLQELLSNNNQPIAMWHSYQ